MDSHQDMLGLPHATLSTFLKISDESSGIHMLLHRHK